jgi:hypothetical protein
MQTDEILLSRPVNTLVLNQLNVDARSHGVMDFELIGGVILVKDELPKVSQSQKVKDENKNMHHGLLIDRKQVRKIYAAEIEVFRACLEIRFDESNYHKLIEHSTSFPRTSQKVKNN